MNPRKVLSRERKRLPKFPWWVNLLLAVGVPTLVAWLTAEWLQGKDVGPVFTAYPLAIILVAVIGGANSGLVATAAAAILSLGLGGITTNPAMDHATEYRLLTFLINGAGISFICGLLRRHVLRVEESLQWFEIVTGTVPSFTWLMDPKGNMEWVSRSWLQFTGRTIDEELGMQWTESTFPTEREPLLSTIRTQISRQLPLELTVRLKRKDEVYRVFLLQGKPYFSDGGFAGYIGTGVDVTASEEERERQESTIDWERRARSEAERSSHARDEFVANLSHELRTPLTSIQGWVEILKRRPPTPEMLEEGLSSIEQGVRAQTRMVEDLLDVSRMASGKLIVGRDPVDLCSVAEQCGRDLAPAASKKRISLVVETPDHALIVSGDRERMIQIVSNLLLNAIKFTPNNGNVKVHIGSLGVDALITVQDSGIGIDPEILPLIFERFRQSEQRADKRFGGLGLGLSIVKQLVEAYGGRIVAESPGVGKGSKFTITLPLIDSTAERTVHPQMALEENALRGRKILLVEDDPMTRATMKRVLFDFGADVRVASNAFDGLAILRKELPDVILSDLGLPEIDGFQFIAKVRSLKPEEGGNVPAIAVSAFVQESDQKLALEAGFQMFAAKPVVWHDLVSKIQSLTQETSSE